ncbi:glycosyltransferase family 2 protein [bacterium]|nr:glycosyltransferase family 2 protein [bacterium]
MSESEFPVLYIICPCYNEEPVLPDSSEKLKNKLLFLKGAEKISAASKILFVDDGSKDKTWQIIQNLHENAPEVFSGISLAHNAGQQNALLAGLLAVKDRCDIAVTLDVDLQDDIEAIDMMVDKYSSESCSIVYGCRNDRASDTFFKRFTAESFYRFMNFMGVKLVFNHAEFRLMDRRALKALADFKEVNLFLRGLVPMIGLKQDCVYYERKKRLAGETKYSLSSLLNLAWQAVTSMSVMPIRSIMWIGVGMALLSVMMFIYALVSRINGIAISGWTSLMISIWFIGGLNLFSIGIIGEYIGKIYLEVKHRPRFIIDKYLDINVK